MTEEQIDKVKLVEWLKRPNPGSEYYALTTAGKAVFKMALESTVKEIERGTFDSKRVEGNDEES